MSQEQDLSSYAVFNVDDILDEIKAKGRSKKEVTAYLDRSFIDNMIKEYRAQEKISEPDFTVDNRINYTDYNFTGADFRGISFREFALFNFTDCDITAVHLDRAGVNFFREYMIGNRIIFQGLNLERAYLGPEHLTHPELGIECYVFLNLSNLNLAGSNFRYADIEGLILENTNISSCDFTNARNLNPEHFAFTIGFEKAIFSDDPKKDAAIKAKIKEYSETLEPEDVINHIESRGNKFINYLATMTNVIDD